MVNYSDFQLCHFAVQISNDLSRQIHKYPMSTWLVKKFVIKLKKTKGNNWLKHFLNDKIADAHLSVSNNGFAQLELFVHIS